MYRNAWDRRMREQNWSSKIENDRSLEAVIHQLAYYWSQVNFEDMDSASNSDLETILTDGKFRDEIENPWNLV